MGRPEHTGLAFVDTETTGLNPHLHPIWEVGLILDPGPGSSPGGDTVERSWLVFHDTTHADPFALGMNGYWERWDREKAVGPGEFAAEFTQLTAGRTLIGAVPSFDERRLWDLVRSCGYVDRWHYQPVDVETLAVGWLMRAVQWADRQQAIEPETLVRLQEDDELLSLPWDSHALSLAVGVDPERFERHSALGDARWARAIYRAVTSGDSIPRRA